MVILRAGNMRPQLLHKKDQKSALIKKRTALLMQIALVVSFMWLEQLYLESHLWNYTGCEPKKLLDSQKNSDLSLYNPTYNFYECDGCMVVTWPCMCRVAGMHRYQTALECSFKKVTKINYAYYNNHIPPSCSRPRTCVTKVHARHARCPTGFTCGFLQRDGL